MDFAGFRLGAFLDAIQLMPPVALKRASPFVQRPDRRGIGSIELLAAVAAHMDQAYVSQYAEML